MEVAGGKLAPGGKIIGGKCNSRGKL